MPAVDHVIAALNKHGLLLRQDKSLSSVVTIIAGEPIAGSWWAHPKSAEIFRCLSDLQLQSDVLETKLLAGKVTLVHRRLWPALPAVAESGEPWQTRGLSADAKSLCQKVQKQQTLIASGPLAKELETRLLVHGSQVHTESGHHETRLESWQHWSERVGCPEGLSAEKGRVELEAALIFLGGKVTQLGWRRVRCPTGSPD